jgi:hypothetical protein
VDDVFRFEDYSELEVLTAARMKMAVHHHPDDGGSKYL